jgi:hypothetical protein
MSKFKVGQTYTTRSIGDANMVISMSVISRTAKTIKADAGDGIKSLRVAEYQGAECVKPWGSYSMAPVIRAA